MPCIIEVKDLKREYVTWKGWPKRKKNIVKAVNGISFSVEKGEIFGLLGQNGAGKTTTIKMLITLLAPTSGTCKVLGYDTFREAKKIRPQINFIFGGEMGVYRRLSARDNLRYFSNLYGIDTAVREKRIDEILKLVDLYDKADLLAETYSKGMIQRLQIARGLINDPEIILMDEPTVGLDPIGARMLRDIIKKLKAQGKTVILTTHYMFEADELCDHIAIINKGHMVAMDTPEGLKQRAEKTSTMEIAAASLQDSSIEKIKCLKDVYSAQVSQGEEFITLTVKYNQTDENISSQVFDILRGEKILSFSHKELTLEDAYIQLLEGDK